VDAGAERAEFLAGYYGAAAPAVEEYVSVLEKAFARADKDHHLLLYRSLWENEAPYLERTVLDRARKALARARKRADDDPAVLERLDRIEAGLNYTELFYHERPGRRHLAGRRCECAASPRRRKLVTHLFRTARRSGITHYAEDYGRYTTMSCLGRAWRDSIGRHATVTLSAGASRAVIVPGLGGRIVCYGPAAGRVNVLGEGSPKTFGYPCCGGYEEYSLSRHPSPGFCEAYEVAEKSASRVVLRAELETGLTLVRSVRLDPRRGDAVVRSALTNRRRGELPGCLRAHLEIDLRTPPGDVLMWWLRGGSWEAMKQEKSGAWYEDEVPDGWAFWSPWRRLGVIQQWSRAEVGAVYLGTISSEPHTIVLDLVHARDDAPVPPGRKQAIRHQFAWFEEPPFLT